MSPAGIQELMAVVMARELRDGELAIMGAVSALPLAACEVARATRAPGLWYIVGGSGAVCAHPTELPESSCDRRLLCAAETALPLPEVILVEGRGDLVDVFFAGGLQVDAEGSCNLAAVGDYARPQLRGPGGVGLPFLARAGRTISYTLSHTPRTLVERVDFVSGPGVTASVLVTPLCVFEFAPRARLRSLHPGVTFEQVRAATGFELAGPGDAPVTAPPTAMELDALRRADPQGVLRRAG